MLQLKQRRACTVVHRGTFPEIPVLLLVSPLGVSLVESKPRPDESQIHQNLQESVFAAI